MKKTLFLLLFVEISQLMLCQSSSFHFGKVTQNDLMLKRYPKDTTTEAAVLYEAGRSYFEDNANYQFDLYFECKTRIKVFSKAGLKWAQMSIPFTIEDNISDISGYTYNLEGGNIQTTPLDPATAFTEKIDRYWSNLKIAMPNVKEGSVFEISYKIKSSYLFNLRGWEFQREIPVQYSEYTTQIVPFYQYAKVLQGTKNFSNFIIYEDPEEKKINDIAYHDIISKFIMKDVPAFKNEKFITTPNDYIIKINFQLEGVKTSLYTSSESVMTTWAKLGEEMLGNEYFGKYLTSAQSISDELLLSIPDISTKSDLEKVKAIDSYMKKNFSWNGRDDKFTDSNAKLFLSKKTGNAAEINLFETALLTKAGIKAYPVILSTRDHGKISKNYPFHHFFNYVITSAKINGTTILLDATNLLNPYDVLPSKCLNDSGLVIQKNQVRWEKIANTSISKTVYDFTIHPNTKQNHVDQECLLSATGYDAIDFRNQFIYSYKDLKEKMLDGNTYTTDTLSQENLNNIDKPFILKFKKEYPMEYVDNKIIIAPFSNIPITDNPLQQDSRTFPIDMTYPHINQFHSIVEVPEGYKLLSKPENMNLDNDNFKICYISTLENGKVSIDGLYEFKHAIYDSSAYSELKTAFKEIINKFNDKILLVKNL